MEKQLFHQIHQLSRKLTKKLNEALLPHGLYGAQWSVLYVLKEKRILTQKELCEYLSVEAPPMTRMIKRLTEQGFVSFENGEDRRKKYIKLTPKAIELFPLWDNAVSEMNKNLLQSFPEQSRQELSALISMWMRQM